MRYFVVVLWTYLFPFVIFSPVFAQEMKTPYGDYCPKCSEYGVCKKFLTVEESRDAVEGYFDKTDIVIGIIRGRGRFLKIELLKMGELHDIILFDRKTGRIRSIY